MDYEKRLMQHKICILVFVFMTLFFFSISVIIASFYGLKIEESAIYKQNLDRCLEENING